MMLDVADLQIVIIGGGAVASRKAAGLVAAGAKRIRVIAIEFRASFPDEIERHVKLYDRADLKDAGLVFAATDSAAGNDAVVGDARSDRILVCRADGSEQSPGDFSTPANFAMGSITVTVSTQSAALSATIRDLMRDCFDPQWAAMAEAMKTLRPIIKSSDRSACERAAIFRMLASQRGLEILRDQGIEGLKNWIATMWPHTL